MSKSLKRVTAALNDCGLAITPIEMDAQTRTAQQAADAIGCDIDQIAKSIIFQGQNNDKLYLFVTAGGNQVDLDLAQQAAGEALQKADAAAVRKQTGFAIGGVSPVGHLNPIKCFIDPRLRAFQTVYAAAGTPHHVFPIDPDTLSKIATATQRDFVGPLR